MLFVSYFFAILVALNKNQNIKIYVGFFPTLFKSFHFAAEVIMKYYPVSTDRY